MKKFLILVTCGAMLAACGGGGSFGGFGGSSAGSSASGGRGGLLRGILGTRKEEPKTVEEVRVEQYGGLVPAVRSIAVERTTSGAILRVVGQAARQGYYDVRLVPLNDGEPDETGALVYELRAKAPEVWTGAATPRAREIHAATHVSNKTLAKVNRLVVLAAQNQVSAGR